MRSKKAPTVVTAFSILALAALPALAGHGSNGKGHGHGKGATEVEDSGGGHHHGGKGHHHSSANSHSNKGGELQGLNRANEVAGPHGEEGRENAASHHGGGSSGGDTDE